MKTIIPAQAFPVSLAEAKHQMAIFHSEDDNAVQALIAMATQEAEEYGMLCTLFQTVEEVLPSFPAGMIVLSGLPFASINSIKYYDAEGALQTLSSEAYRVYSHGRYAQVEVIDTWPTTYCRQDAVQVEYVIGHATLVEDSSADDDTITVTNHPFADGERVVVYKATDGALPAGLTERKIYYIVNAAEDTVQLSLTEGGAAVDITQAGTGQWYIGYKEVPRTIKQAILMTIAGCNEYRTDEITGTIVNKVALTSRYLLDHTRPKTL